MPKRVLLDKMNFAAPGTSGDYRRGWITKKATLRYAFGVTHDMAAHEFTSYYEPLTSSGSMVTGIR
jgi:hypothetical protein